jgi:hypothetical protein
MNYTIHLIAPKTGRLTPSMLQWLIEHGADETQPEFFNPVRKVNPKALARVLLKLDPTLIPEQDEYGNVVLIYPKEELGIRIHIHNRGVVIAFPFMGGMLAHIVLHICYIYIRYLYDQAGFWSFDPHLNLISYADDYQSIDETLELMEALLPKLLNG